MGNWLRKNMGTICQLAYGKNLATSLFTREGYKVFGANSIIGFYSKYTHEEEEVLVSSRGEYSGVINFSEPKSYVTNNSIVCKLKLDLDKRFLFYALKNIPRQSFVSGSAQPQVVIQDLEKFEVYYPEDKPEQTRIAQILSKADSAIAQTEALIAKYQRIKTGLMQDLLTKGIDEHGNIRSEQTHRFKTEKGLRVPVDWEVNELRQYISYISYGFTNPMPEAPEGPYLITAANINEGRILYESCRRTTEKAFKELLTNKSRPKINDVLITKDGSLGRMAIVDRENLCINQSVAVMRTIPEKIDFKFFKMLLESDSYQATIIGDAGGSTIKHIYITKIDKMILAVPKELDEQIRILNTIEKHNKLIEDSKNQLAKIQSLKTGLMQDLLSGKVRVAVKEETLVNP